MRLRKQSADGDMIFGGNQQSFLIDTPDAVAQLVGTRLRLLLGEWYLNTSEGMPWLTEVIGVRTGGTRDAAIRRRVLDTQGVTSIVSYSSALDGRAFSAQMVIETLYGRVLAVVSATQSPTGIDGLDFRFSSNSQFLTII